MVQKSTREFVLRQVISPGQAMPYWSCGVERVWFSGTAGDTGRGILNNRLEQTGDLRLERDSGGSSSGGALMATEAEMGKQVCHAHKREQCWASGWR